jgi:hypothetical protein
MTTKIIIICERDEWDWRIEAQEGCDSGVDLVYSEFGRSKEEPPRRTCLGGLDDAEALADAIKRYVVTTRELQKDEI